MPQFGRPVEELLRRVPRGSGGVDLVAAAEALDDHRQAADARDLDQELLVGVVESADRARG